MPVGRSILAFAGLVAFIGCGRNDHYYIERGNKFLQEGKVDDAVIQYSKAIQKNPKSGEGYYGLGVAEARQGHATAAFDALNRSVQLSPDNQAAVARFADLNLAAYVVDPRHSKRFYDQVVQLSDQLLAKNPNSVEGLRLKGAIALADRKPQEALGFYQRANQFNATDRDVAEGLVQALFQTGQSNEAERLAKTFLEKDSKAGSIYDILYMQYLASNRFADAEHILLSKVDNNPLEAAYRFQLAGYYARVNKPAALAAVLQYMTGHAKEFPQARLEVGDFYNSIGDRDEAVRQFEEGGRENPKDQIVYQKRIASTLASQGKRDQAAQVIDEILKNHPKDRDALAARAGLLLDSGKPEDVARALGEYQALVKATPDDAVLRFQLGRCYLANGKRPEARSQFLESARRRRDYEAPRLALAEMAMFNHKPEEALTTTEDILSRDPSQARARLLHGAALGGLQRYAQAQAELTELAKEYPQSPEVQAELGLIAVDQKKYNDAEQIFRKIQQAGPANSLAAVGLAESYNARRQYDKAIQLLRDELRKSPGSTAIESVLALTAMRAGDNDVAIEALQQLIQASPKNAALYLSLGEVYVTKQDYVHAVPALEEAKRLAPQDGRPDTLLATVSRLDGRGSDMKAHLEQALRLQPENPVALNNMAFYLAENLGNLEEALRLAQRAVQKSPNEPNFSDTLGWIYIKQNRNAAAQQIFRNLVAKEPDNPTFRYHLAVALLGTGDKQSALTQLQAALEHGPAKDEEPKIRELLAKLK